MKFCSLPLNPAPVFACELTVAMTATSRTREALVLALPSAATTLTVICPAGSFCTVKTTWPLLPVPGEAICAVMPGTGVVLSVIASMLPDGRCTVTSTEAGVPSGSTVIELAESDMVIGPGAGAGWGVSPGHPTRSGNTLRTAQQTGAGLPVPRREGVPRILISGPPNRSPPDCTPDCLTRASSFRYPTLPWLSTSILKQP